MQLHDHTLDSPSLIGEYVGVWELRRDVSGGIRVYYGLQQRRVILLVAGRKRSQCRDLERAVVLWKDFLRRSG